MVLLSRENITVPCHGKVKIFEKRDASSVHHDAELLAQDAIVFLLVF